MARRCTDMRDTNAGLGEIGCPTWIRAKIYGFRDRRATGALQDSIAYGSKSIRLPVLPRSEPLYKRGAYAARPSRSKSGLTRSRTGTSPIKSRVYGLPIR